MFADRQCSEHNRGMSIRVATFALVALLGTATLLASNEEMILLDFASDACPPCRMMDPIVGRLKAEGLPIRRVDVNREVALARQYRITSIPCFVLVVEGREVTRVVGGTSESSLRQMLSTGRTVLARNKQARAIKQQQLLSARGQTPSSQPGIGDMASLTPRNLIPAPSGMDSLKDPFAGHDNIFPKPTRSLPPQPLTPVPKSMPRVVREPQRLPANPLVGNPRSRAQAASVRLKVSDGSGFSFGSGTIIHAQGREALVATCSHIFRASHYKGQIEVEIPHGNGYKKVTGTLIAWNESKEQADVALVAITPGFQVQPVAIVPQRYRPGVGDRVFSIGCDNGGDSLLIESRVTSIDRYMGPANIEATEAPVEGRSGGGIFTLDGKLLGICNCADTTDNEGIYAATSSLYAQLKEKKLLAMFQQKQPSEEMIVREIELNPRTTRDTKVTIFIRDANGNRRTVTLNEPSQHFLQQVNEEHLRQKGPTFADRR